MIEHGFGRADISCFESDMTMMGWGVRTQKVQGVAEPLHARAVVMRDLANDTRVAFVAVDALLVTQGLWFGVIDRLAAYPELGLGAANVILVATHTHSGPSGYGHHFWTNLNAPGFSEPVYAGLRDGIVAAIRTAWEARQPGSVSVAQTVVPLADGTAFNRSWFAYNRNADVTPVSEARRDEATDRTLTVLRFRDAEGQLSGLVQWFALHGTMVHADNRMLHPDHKGLAALALEADGLGVVFAQECCGDVSPNYRWDKKRKHTIGRHDDDFASAAYVAESQVSHTRRALAGPEVPLVGALEVAVRFVDFSCAVSAPEFNRDGREKTTRPAVLGLAMAEGTAEGPGPLRNVRALARTLSRVRGALRGDPKVPFIDLGRGNDGRFGGVLPMGRLPRFDPVLRWVGDAVRAGGVHGGGWVPHIVPLYLVRLGSFALCAVPFEMTTVAGRRLRATLRDALPGVTDVVISTYASAYVGYLTTFEEYQVQHYEAGYTLFGAHSLGALRSECALLAGQLGRASVVGPEPARVDTAPLARLRFGRPWAG